MNGDRPTKKHIRLRVRMEIRDRASDAPFIYVGEVADIFDDLWQTNLDFRHDYRPFGAIRYALRQCRVLEVLA